MRYYLCKTSGLVSGEECYQCYQKQRALLGQEVSFDFPVSRPLCQKKELLSPSCFSLKFGQMGCDNCLAKVKRQCEVLFMELAAAPERELEKKEEAAAAPVRSPKF